MSVVVSPVSGRRDLRDFIQLPHRIYRHDPNWVPPLRAELRRQLDPAKNPFFAHAEAAFFLARRDGEVVGRISAHVDRRHNEIHRSVDGPGHTGLWGFFECVDDVDAADALFGRAATWLAERGMEEMVGPASFTLNDEAGLLVDGFHLPPVIAMTYNPRYYEALVEKCGFEGVQDLYAYRLDATAELPEIVVEAARSARAAFHFRTIDMKRFDDEVARFLVIYNEAWEKNWGHVPMTEEEVREHARQLRSIIDPDLVVIAESEGEPIGVGFTIPDVNQVLIRARGRLGPITVGRILRRRWWGGWGVARVFALGVRAEYRTSGVGAALYEATLDAAKKGGYRWGEMSWILESNGPMNRAIQLLGGERYKNYRMYRRSLR